VEQKILISISFILKSTLNTVLDETVLGLNGIEPKDLVVSLILKIRKIDILLNELISPFLVSCHFHKDELNNHLFKMFSS